MRVIQQHLNRIHPMTRALSLPETFIVNCALANEIIRERLAIPETGRNIRRLARCITELECLLQQQEKF